MPELASDIIVLKFEENLLPEALSVKRLPVKLL